MVSPANLIERLEQIGSELARREGTLALLGLGSAGTERDRMDKFSDLDFFVIVEPGYKQRFIEDLGWLKAIAPLGYSFLNTPDGHKALYEDGVFCEFAVFEPQELSGIPFEAGQVVWHREEFDPASLAPAVTRPEFGAGDEAFVLGELLTNLYVGLGRYARGERLSACIFIQHYAVERLIALLELWGESAGEGDSFSNDRRFEQRFGNHVELIESLTPGYGASPDAAERMLDFVTRHVDVNEVLASEIRRLIAACREEMA